MEEVVRAFLSSRLGTALASIVAIVVGFWLREWTYRNVRNTLNGWNSTRGADLRREKRERKRLQRQNRKKYAHLNEKGSNSSKGSNSNNDSNGNNENIIHSWIRRNSETL